MNDWKKTQPKAIRNLADMTNERQKMERRIWCFLTKSEYLFH